MLKDIKQRIVRDAVEDKELLVQLVQQGKLSVYMSKSVENASDIFDIAMNLIKTYGREELAIEVFEYKEDNKKLFMVVLGEEGYSSIKPIEVAEIEGIYYEIAEAIKGELMKEQDLKELGLLD